MIGLAIVALAIVVALGYARYTRRRMLALDWPVYMEYGQMTKSVTAYLKHHGWAVETLPLALHIMLLKRDQEAIRLICLPSLVEYNGGKIRDLSEMARRHPLVCVTAYEAPVHLRSLAAGGQVLLLHYKKLYVFASSTLDQRALFKAMREDLLGGTGNQSGRK